MNKKQLFANKLDTPIVFLLLIYVVLLFKIYYFRTETFSSQTFTSILLNEFPFWALISTIILLFNRKTAYVLTFVYQLILSFLFLSIIVYTRYFDTVPSYYDLTQIDQANSFMSIGLMLIKSTDILLFLDTFILLPIILYLTYKREFATKKTIKIATVVLFIWVSFTFVHAFKQPIVDVSTFAKENSYMSAQFKQLYMRTIGDSQENHVLSPQEIEQLKGNTYIPDSLHESFGLAKNRHVFVIQLESLQSFLLDLELNGQYVMPNIRNLLEDSARFTKVFQQIGAGNTSDAEWMMHTGLYPIGLEPTVKELTGNLIPSLPRTLQNNGYVTSTFHADEITFWHRDKLYPSLGFEHIYTENEIPKEDIIDLGASDFITMSYATSQIPILLNEKEKLYMNIITLTSHTPFIIPATQQSLKLPTYLTDTYVGNYLQAANYTDRAVGEFIQQLKTLDIYDESLILIYGDHSGLHGSQVYDEEYDLLTQLLGVEYNMQHRFLIPVIFTLPNVFQGEVYDTLGGQLDLMPTLLNLLGIEHNSQMFGHNLFHYVNNLLGMRYYMGGGSYINNDEMYFAPNAVREPTLYRLQNMNELDVEDYSAEQSANLLRILNSSDELLYRQLRKTQLAPK